MATSTDAWDIDSSEDDVIDDITLDGNESLFTALAIMKVRHCFILIQYLLIGLLFSFRKLTEQ